MAGFQNKNQSNAQTGNPFGGFGGGNNGNSGFGGGYPGGGGNGGGYPGGGGNGGGYPGGSGNGGGYPGGSGNGGDYPGGFGNGSGNNGGSGFGGGYNGGSGFGGGYNGGSGFGGGYNGGSGFGGGYQGGGMPPKTVHEDRFGLIFLIASILAAVLFFIVGEFLYRFVVSSNSIIFVGIYFGVFGLMLFLALFLAARIKGLEISGRRMAVALVCLLALFGLGMLFEFLYELNPLGKVEITTSYVIAMDNSGSMEENDPAQKRIDALNDLLKDKPDDFRFAVYSFGLDVKCIREMAPKSDGIGELALPPDGGTPIQSVLNMILDDMDSGKLAYDEGTQVILLTDGIATDTDFMFNSLLKKFVKKRVSISTVGLGDSAYSLDLDFLNNISDTTGGKTVTTDNVDELANAMASVVRVVDGSRDLLSHRPGYAYQWLYALMRIVFVTILGLLLMGIKISALDESAQLKLLIITSVIGSILGAVILEVGMQLLPMAFLIRLLMVLLLALTLVVLEVERKMQNGYGGMSRIR